MLVLSRGQLEAVVIDGRILVTVLEVRNGKVRLGFQAPGEINIVRKEILDMATVSGVCPSGIGHALEHASETRSIPSIDERMWGERLDGEDT